MLNSIRAVELEKQVASGIRDSDNNDADGPQGFEDDDAINSLRPTSEKHAFSALCLQIGHTRNTAASAGGRNC